VRDSIAYAEVARIPLCVLSLDFKEAFDRISHTYLFTILKGYGFSDIFIERIKNMNDNATSVVQINGQFSGPILAAGIPVEHVAVCPMPESSDTPSGVTIQLCSSPSAATDDCSGGVCG
jgi:hypothetical protein